MSDKPHFIYIKEISKYLLADPAPLANKNNFNNKSFIKNSLPQIKQYLCI
jgi:hypothetical protein